MRLSARNQFKGKIVEVKKGATTSHIRIDIGGQIVTASITNESADEMKLEAGKPAYATRPCVPRIVPRTGLPPGFRAVVTAQTTAGLTPGGRAGECQPVQHSLWPQYPMVSGRELV